MNTTVKEHRTCPIATSENTIFITVAAYEDYESKTAVLRQTAEDYGISITFCDMGEPWQGFYQHKIEKMSKHLRRFRDEGKDFAFILDCRDVVFIESIDSILTKFNAMNDGQMIFNQDPPGCVWPSHKGYLAQAVENAMGSEYVRLNAGMIAGNIETILKIQCHVIEIRRELKEGCPRPGIAEMLYQDIGTDYSDDDQHLYQICATYYPELFRNDYNKELFALLMFYPKDIQECSDDPNRHDVINNAAIVHSPWLACGHEWNDWALQHRWQR